MQLVGLMVLAEYIQHAQVQVRGKYLCLPGVYIQMIAHLLDCDQ